jgi:hypothetical protein
MDKIIHFNKLIERNCESKTVFFWEKNYEKMFLGKKLMIVQLYDGSKLIGKIENNKHIINQFIVRFKK